MSVFDFNFGPKKKGPDTVPDGDTAQALKLLRSGITRRLLFLVVFVIALILFFQCVVITMPDQYVVIKQFGQAVNITTQPGISFKLPFIQTTSTIPSNIQMYDMPVTSDVITQDKKTMVADSFVLWRVADPMLFTREASGLVSSAEPHIYSNAYNSLKNVIGRLPQSEIISGRDTLADQIFADLGDSLDGYGVEVVALETKHLDLPEDNKQAVYARMISERENIAAQYLAEGEEEARIIRNETDKTVRILESNATAQAAETIADGERQYMEILAQAYNDPEKAEFYAFVRALDAAKIALKNGENTLILGRDSPITQIFYNS